MAYSFALECVYLAKEFSRPAPSPLRVVGTLLDSAFQRPEEKGDFDSEVRALLDRLSTVH